MINSLHNLLIKSTYQTGVTMHRILYTLLAFTAILVPAASMAQNQPSATEVNRNQSLDGVIKLYGACGPQNALRKVEDTWERGRVQRSRSRLPPFLTAFCHLHPVTSRAPAHVIKTLMHQIQAPA